MPTALAIASETQLPSLVKEAAAALARATSAAEVLAARDMASTVYDMAKRTARLQKAKKAHDELIGATYRVQADSLEIESLAKRRLADEYDAAQPAGAAKGGRPKTVPDGNGFTAEEAGLNRKQVFEARQMRDAIEQDPGIVRRALDQMLAAGAEPTRAGLKRAAADLPPTRPNLRAAVGTDSATAAERGNNLYETPAEAMRALLSLTRFGPTVWEPACGRGAISRVLEDAGYEVTLSDLIDYGTHSRDGEVQEVGDFLATTARKDCPDIVTNPPYGQALNAFVAHALRVHRPRKMALLLNLNFLCGFDDPDRCFAMDVMPPSRLYVFSRRLPMMHRDGWDGPEASSRMNTAWFIWELRSQADGSESYDGRTEMLRVDWKVFEGASLIGPDKLEGKRGFRDALKDYTEYNRLKARGDDLSADEAARLAGLTPIVEADLAPVAEEAPKPKRERPRKAVPA
ncbi:MAG: SAM-dependent methyltransferase [Mesorhizobium sp.]|uniref:SAM-dependent methyltransferase n=1 Tax=Mesorhizobium sp. TaxID=1871066 RepID=UPI000FE5E52F|nr:SAM-dependent methyltransferase [Mesorhizobium sp.]RWQ56539.1 MAG: SAM-dependent methyltransferase [Mesorhizobium sp.]